jgi:hypothetical protein
MQTRKHETVGNACGQRGEEEVADDTRDKVPVTLEGASAIVCKRVLVWMLGIHKGHADREGVGGVRLELTFNVKLLELAQRLRGRSAGGVSQSTVDHKHCRSCHPQCQKLARNMRERERRGMSLWERRCGRRLSECFQRD